MIDQALTVAICYSPSWAEYVRVEVCALAHTNPGCTVYLLSDANGRLDLPGCVFVDVDDLFRQRVPTDRSVSSRFTKYAHYRLLLPEIVQESRVLYIDADAIVDGDLSPLWNIDLGDCVLAGVQDVGMTPSQLAAVGMRPGDTYVNAGVTLLDLGAIRRDGIYERWLQEINTNAYSCGDQDVINLTCRGRIKRMGNEWNSSLSTGFAVCPRIVHFAGPPMQKPWVPGTTPKNAEVWHRWATLNEQTGNVAGTERIPRIIHTSWFGGAEMPDLAKACMDTWREQLPGYRIQVWDESNMDPLAHGPAFVRDAYRARKWAFVTDWMRLRALYWEGGIYLDTDVQVLRRLDRFLTHRAFTGHEADRWMLSATMGAEPLHPWVKMLLDHYGTAAFSETPNTQVVTRLSEGWVERKRDGYAYLRGGVVVYPTDFFTPFDHQALKPTPTDRTHTIHHFAGSWLGRHTTGRDIWRS